MQGSDSPKIINAGLPNIKGFTAFGNGDTETTAAPVSGAFYYDRTSARVYTGNSPSTQKNNLAFDAGRNNTIYGASETVQPPALTLIPQIKY